MQHQNFLRQFLLCGSLLLVSSCGYRNNDPYARNAVTGTVNLDGRPLVTGSIVFFPTEQGPVVSGTTIRDGIFTIPAEQGLPAGSYKVAITATTTKKPASADPDELFENPPTVFSIIPAKYNSQTTLLTEVKDAAKNDFPFELTSK